MAFEIYNSVHEIGAVIWRGGTGETWRPDALWGLEVIRRAEAARA